MIRRPCLVALIAAVCAAHPAATGPARAESVFGLNLVGERFEVGDARTAALGGFVQLIDDSLGVLQYNPAGTAWAKRVTFSVGGYVTSDKNSDGTSEEKSVSTKISGLMVAFPLFRKTLSFAAGYRGRYDPDGEFSVMQETSEGDVYADRFERSGGLWTVPFVLAADLGSFAKLGGYYSLERGSIQNRWVVDFQGSSTADAVSTQDEEFSAGGWGAGAVLRPFARVSLGVAYDAAIDYNVDVSETHTNTSANVEYQETVSLPERWTASASVRLASVFVVYAGGSVSDFEQFRGLAFPAGRLTREQVVSVGLEYLARFPIRASATWEQLPYEMPDGESIQRVAFSLGSGLLFKSRRGKLDLALQFGRTGSVDTNTYEDQFVRFFMSVAGSEEWKRKRESRY